MIHQDEMVLPAHLAEGVRQMSGQGGGQNITYQIHAIDARGVRDFLRQNGAAVSDTVASQARNFRNRRV
jgi:hypothetical protein